MSADPYEDIPDAYADIPGADDDLAAAPPAPAPPPPAPEPRATINDFGRRSTALDDLIEYGPGFVGETAQDALRGANQGLTWLGSDELVAGAKAAGGGDFSQAAEQERAMNALAEERSPAAYQLSRAAGFIPGMVAGPAAGAIRTAMPAAQGVVSGALGSDSGDWGETALDALKGGFTTILAQLGLTGGGKLLSSAGQRLSKGVPQPGGTAAPRPPTTPPPAAAAAEAAPQQMTLPRVGTGPEQLPLPGMARPAPIPMAEPVPPPPATPPMQQPRWTAPGLRQYAQEAADDPAVAQKVMGKMIKGAAATAGGAQMGHNPAAAAATAAGGAMFADELGAASQKLAPPLLRGAAAGVAGVGNTANVVGEGMQAAGWMAPPVSAGLRNDAANASRPRIDDMAPPAPSAPAATANGRGNLLPQAALDTLYNDAAALGPYQQDFAQAAVNRDAGAVGALISRLTQTDPKFRQTVLPELQRRTSAPYQPPGPRR